MKRYTRIAAVVLAVLSAAAVLSVNASQGPAVTVAVDADDLGGVVTSRNHVHYVVTEYGVADLYGKSIRQRAQQKKP